MKLDILAFGAHPDDVELGAAGTLAKHAALGYTTGIADLTRGELGTRGTPEQRLEEATRAAEILGVSVRENLGFRDGFFVNDEAHQMEVIRIIRKYRPEVILANALYDRHPDHGKGADLLRTSVFHAGLRNVPTSDNGKPQEPWRPRAIYHYIQFRPVPAQLVVDISGYLDKKMESILAYGSQFYAPGSSEPKTLISSPAFLENVKARAQEWGLQIGTTHGEAFSVERIPGTGDLLKMF